MSEPLYSQYDLDAAVAAERERLWDQESLACCGCDGRCMYRGNAGSSPAQGEELPLCGKCMAADHEHLIADAEKRKNGAVNSLNSEFTKLRASHAELLDHSKRVLQDPLAPVSTLTMQALQEAIARAEELTK